MCIRDSANAVVTGGNANMVINLPAMDKVIGYPEVADIIAGGFDGSLQKDGSIAVSYTHLDVYKRQGGCRPDGP